MEESERYQRFNFCFHSCVAAGSHPSCSTPDPGSWGLGPCHLCGAVDEKLWFWLQRGTTMTVVATWGVN